MWAVLVSVDTHQRETGGTVLVSVDTHHMEAYYDYGTDQCGYLLQRRQC